jgi:hypothetical protein
MFCWPIPANDDKCVNCQISKVLQAIINSKNIQHMTNQHYNNVFQSNPNIPTKYSIFHEHIDIPEDQLGTINVNNGKALYALHNRFHVQECLISINEYREQTKNTGAPASSQSINKRSEIYFTIEDFINRRFTGKMCLRHNRLSISSERCYNLGLRRYVSEGCFRLDLPEEIITALVFTGNLSYHCTVGTKDSVLEIGKLFPVKYNKSNIHFLYESCITKSDAIGFFEILKHSEHGEKCDKIQ